MDSAFLHSLLQTDKEMESFLLIEAEKGKVGRRGRVLKVASIKRLGKESNVQLLKVSPEN